MSSLVLKDCLPPSFYRLIADATHKLLGQDKETGAVIPRAGRLMGIADKISMDDFYDQLASCIGLQVLEFMGLKAAVMLQSFHEIRRVDDQGRHITGLHYDFHVSNAIANSVEPNGQSVTVWIPMKSITRRDAGLIVFDKDVTLLDIHQAAGEEGYFSNIPYASASSDNKRGMPDVKYEKYIRNEDSIHIVDILADLTCDTESLDEFYALHKSCLKNLYSRLEGRYYVTEMEVGDVLLFDSDCYHGTYIPGETFEPRISIDLRVVSLFDRNDETDIFGGLIIRKP